MTTKPSVVAKCEQSTKKVKSADRFAFPVSELKVPDDYEDDLPIFLPSQLDQVCQQFMQSGVDIADKVAPLASVEMRNVLHHRHRLFVKRIKTVLVCP